MALCLGHLLGSPAAPAAASIPHAPVTDALENHVYGMPYRPLMQPPGGTEWDEPWNVLLMLVSFPDQPAISSPDYFVDMLFGHHTGDTATRPYAHGSMADMYARMSNGALTFAPPEVVGWIEAPKPYTYYTGYPFSGEPPTPKGCYGVGTGAGFDTGAWLLVRDLLDEAVSRGIDLSRFDNDGDGNLDGLMLVHSGYGAEQTANDPEFQCDPGVYAGDIWSHQHGYYYSRDDHQYWVRYVVGPEKSMTADDGLSKAGVWAHEFGHLLRLPDLYAMREQGGFGVGCWDLMGYGIGSCDAGFQGDDRGRDPSEFSGWTRQTLNWAAPTEVTANVCNRPVEPLVQGGEILKVTPDPADPRDYFLLEYRARSGPLEEDFPGDLVCVWHIDERKAGVSRLPNEYVCLPNHEAPGACGQTGEYYGVSLVQPDGAYSLERKKKVQSAGHCMAPHATLSNRDNYDLRTWRYQGDMEWTIRTGALGKVARISIELDEDAEKVVPVIDSAVQADPIRGRPWAYQAGITKESGMPLWSLVSGPEDMTIDRNTGLVQWKVPADLPDDEVELVIDVANCGGTARQSMVLRIQDEPVVQADSGRWGCNSGGAGPTPQALLLILLSGLALLRRASLRLLPVLLLVALASGFGGSGTALAEEFPPTDALENHVYGMPYRPALAAPQPEEWAAEPWRILVLKVDFDDQVAIDSPGYFEDMLFGRHGGFDAGHPYPFPTMADLYERMSGGLLTFAEPVVTEWMRAPELYSWYASYPGDKCYGLNDGKDTGAWELMRFALEKAVADLGLNLSDFDNDGDGMVDGVLLIHAGHGAEQTVGSKGCDDGGDIWSHQHGHWFEDEATEQAIWVRYVVGPEKSTRSSSGLSKMGVWAHEFGHLLRLPDLYEHPQTGGGVGCWDLMDAGIRSCAFSYLGTDPDTDPNEFSTWTRKTLNWTQPTPVTANVCNHRIDAMISGGETFKVTPAADSPHDYFLVEYRPRLGPLEKDLPADGVCIYHVDERKFSAWRDEDLPRPNAQRCLPNENPVGACADEHYALSVVQPDGRYSLERSGASQSAGHCLGADSFLSSRDNRDMLPWSGEADFDWSVRTGALGPRARVTILVGDDDMPPQPVFDGVPEVGAVRGTTWTYAPALVEPDTAEWFLPTGPEGMNIDGETGEVVWAVPADYASDEVRVRLRVESCGGIEEQFFLLGVYDSPGRGGCGCSTAASDAGSLAGTLLTFGFLILLRRRLTP